MLRIRQKTKQFIYTALGGAGTAGLLFGVAFWFYHNQVTDKEAAANQRYQNELSRLKEQNEQSYTQGWRPSRNIGAGEKLNASDLIMSELPSDQIPDDYIASKENIAGKMTKIALKQNTLITESLLYVAEPASDDLRNREISFVKIPGVLKAKDVIDVRIQFPTGQDYILLSKKKVKDLKASTLTLTLTEAEILSISSAVVDAYLHKASIYALTYVEPELQNSAIPTYPPNDQVLKLIAKDPNIIKQAEHGLSITSRALLEQDLSVLTPQTTSAFEGKQVEYFQASKDSSAKIHPDQEQAEMTVVPMQ